MRLLTIRRRRWGSMYGDTYRGIVVLLLGVPIWRWRTPIR